MEYVEYKGEKFEVTTIDEYSGLKTIPLKHLSIRERDINSINEIHGLFHLKGLQSLDLSRNNITNMDGLEKLKNLKQLNLGANQISTIEGIGDLIHLTHLNLGDNISEIKGLEKLVNLTHLTLGRNISEITNLAHLKNLKSLDLSRNQISEIKELEFLTNLLNLDLSSNRITEIKGLSTLKNLGSLNLSFNKIEQIKGLEDLKKISNLDLSKNQISEIKGVELLTNLLNLDLSSNRITEIKGIDSLLELNELNLSYNQITSIKGIESLHDFIFHLHGNPLPKVEMQRFRGYINDNFVVHVHSYGNQILTLFNNSHEKIRDNSYSFSIYCSNIDGTLPNPDFELNLHLIDPQGRALQPFRMDVRPSDLQGPDYNSKKAVKFYISIDLNTLCEEEGVWHYFFTLKSESNKNKTVYVPKNGYILGPKSISMTPTGVFMISVSSILGRNYFIGGGGGIPAGFLKNDFEFNFEQNFFYNKELKDVCLCLIPAKKTEGVGISNTVGIKKFNMKPVNSNPSSLYLSKASYIINFEQLGYKDAELGVFSHYYETILNDGTRGFLCQEKCFYSKHENSEGTQKWINEDFHGPFVASNHPQLIDYLFEDLDHSIYSPSFFLGEIECILPEKEPKTEYQVEFDYHLRFEVLYSDSKGNTPSEGYPRLILKNKELNKKCEYIMFPSNIIGSLRQYYGEVFNSYVCDVDWAHIDEGIWNFYFEVRISDGKLKKSLLGKEKFLRI